MNKVNTEALIKNAKTPPKRYFGLHMAEGVAEYAENGETPYRILINENTLKNMDPTYECRPVYVKHVDEVNLEKIQTEADGFVVKSFYNKSDGKHWVEFIVVSDKGHQAIQNGWRLSNAYVPKQYAGGGLWHGVEYAKEVMQGEYEHLAIVDNPRYEESIILTPDQFKTYNNEKELELKKLTNSKTKGDRSMFDFFKKTKVENTAEFDSMTIVLPKSKKEKTLSQIVNEADEHEIKTEKDKGEKQYANGDHFVKSGEEEMTVNELLERHQKMKDAMSGKGAAGEQDEKPEPDLTNKAPKKNDEKPEPQMENEEDKKKKEKKEEEEAKKNAEKAEEEKAKKNANFEAIKNAQTEALRLESQTKVDLTEDKVARGKARYGSGN